MVLHNNFGFYLAGLFRNPTSALPAPTAGFIDSSGVPFSAPCYHTEAGAVLNSDNQPCANGSIQIGKGTTPATRFDLALESPFTNGGVEDSPVCCSPMSFIPDSGKISQGTIISPTTGSGTITEVVKHVNLSGGKACIWSRDTISPANFIAGQSINVDEEILI